MARKKKTISKVESATTALDTHTGLEEASVADATLDTQMFGDPFNPVDQPVNMINDPNTMVEPQEFYFGAGPVEGDPPTLLDELVQVAEAVKQKEALSKERDDDIQLVNAERDQKLVALAQVHLPSRYYEAKQEVLISAQRGNRDAVVATFQYPLNAYDETLFKSLKRMFTADAMTVADQIVPQTSNESVVELKVLW